MKIGLLFITTSGHIGPAKYGSEIFPFFHQKLQNWVFIDRIWASQGGKLLSSFMDGKSLNMTWIFAPRVRLEKKPKHFS